MCLPSNVDDVVAMTKKYANESFNAMFCDILDCNNVFGREVVIFNYILKISLKFQYTIEKYIRESYSMNKPKIVTKLLLRSFGL